MKGLKLSNEKIAKKLLSINLPDGEVLKSMHTCNIIIPGLPTVLTGHIVQGLMMASLVRIRILCKSGCQVIFTEEYCNVMYNRRLILRGYKSPNRPLDPPNNTRRHHATVDCGKRPRQSEKLQPIQVATFTHSVRTRANTVKNCTLIAV
jgi:hypothetical protein